MKSTRYHLKRLGETSTIDLVTLTLGGNDLGFGPIITRCVLAGLAKRLHDAETRPFGSLLHRLAPGLQDKIDALLGRSCQEDLSSAIRRVAADLTGNYLRIADDAPAARLLVLGYPSFFPSHVTGRWCDGVIAAADAEWASEEITSFDRAIRGAVERTGDPRITYVDPGAWSGHDICQPAHRAWFIKPNVLGGLLKTGLTKVGRLAPLFDELKDAVGAEPALSTAMYFHPNATGQADMARADLEALQFLDQSQGQ